jgi:hypothetical protein
MDATSEVRGPGRGGVAAEKHKAAYTTPRWVQVWFLRRSRDNWKRKYMELKADAKRLQNRVNDVTKSRERWRALADGSGNSGGEGEPPEAALKKGGAGGGAAGGGAAGRRR